MNWRRIIAGLCTLLLSLATSAAPLPVEDFFTWIEKTFPDAFPKGPKTAQIDFRGCKFDYRGDYGGGYYIGVCRSDGYIYSYRSNTGELVKHYPVDDHKCDARPDLCAPPSFAGTIVLADDGHTINPNYKDNKGLMVWGVGRDGNGFEIPASEIEAVCFHSIRLNNWGMKTGVGCNKSEVYPKGGGWLFKITGLPNNDCGRYTFWRGGLEYYLDLTSITGYKFTGLNAKLNSSCGVEYGPKGFTPAKVLVVQELDKTVTMVWDFGSGFVGGYGSAQFDLSDKAKTYLFVLNGSHTGKDYKDGWGLGEGRKTTSGDKIEPSVKWAWLEIDPVTGNRILKFRNLACTDKVNATAYVGTGPSDKVVYDYGRDGFGLAWASVGGDAPFWTAGTGVTIDKATSQLHYGVPFCTQK